MAAVTGGMAEVDATVHDGRRLGRGAASDDAPVDPAAGPADDRPMADATDPGTGPGRRRRRRRRTLWSDLRRLVGTPARRARLLVWLAVLAVAVTAPLLARSGASEARAELRAQGAERVGAAEERAAVEAAEQVAGEELAVGVELADQARAAHNEQRRRLAGIGLNEQTIEPHLVAVDANAALVEYRRDSTTEEVDRQAAEIPQMQACVQVAQQALNAAWNSATFGDTPPPAPAETCRALLAAGP